MYHVKNNINKKFICFDKKTKKKNTKVKTKRYFPCKWPYFIELYPRARNFVYICFHQYSMILFPYITIKYNFSVDISKHPSLQFYLIPSPDPRLYIKCLYSPRKKNFLNYENMKALRCTFYVFLFFFFFFEGIQLSLKTRNALKI